MNPIFADLPTTIFETMSRLARETGAINLGQGFPDDAGPLDVRQKAADALVHGWNQYPPMMGAPELRQAMARHYRHHQGVQLDAETETLVTSGATEALAGAIFACVKPGDEVVLIQPMYDAYLPLVRAAGATPRFVTLHPPQWRLSEQALAAAFSDKTAAVIFNNPLNPAGVAATREEIALLARFCVKHDAIAICDEVWEHLVYDGRRHETMLALPSMRERTVKIGSAGKIFSLTGWKVGLVVAAPKLMRVLAKTHQFLTFTTPPNLQAAVAYGLAKDDAYFSEMRATYERSRDRLVHGLGRLGFRTTPAEGTYFVNIDIAAQGESDDVAFCERMAREAGVVAIPVSAFYAQDHVRTVVRFCFAKTDATLDAALERLAAWRR
jgi:aspartate/methionine/tyrosine aminotransferase